MRKHRHPDPARQRRRDHRARKLACAAKDRPAERRKWFPAERPARRVALVGPTDMALVAATLGMMGGDMLAHRDR